MISGPTSILPKSEQSPQTPNRQQSLIKVTGTPIPAPSPALQSIQQRVQILRGPDGKLQVRGLMPGQQLVQMPDGKLHVLNTGQTAQQIAAVQTNTPIATTTTTIVSTPTTTPTAAVAASPAGTVVTTKTPQTKIAPVKITPAKTTVVIQQDGTEKIVQQNIQGKRLTNASPQSGKNTILVTSSGQIVQGQQIIQSGGAAQVVAGNQIVVNNPTLAQQLATGKAQLATIGGHQVIIRSTSAGNQIFHLNSTANSGIIVKQNQTTTGATTTPVKIATKVVENSQEGSVNNNVSPSVNSSVNAVTTATTTTSSNNNNNIGAPTSTTVNNTATGQVNATTTTTTTAATTTPTPGSVEASLLAGHPPGTIIKCVTAQVIQTSQGPRIVLQGLQGTEFTPQQLTMVQQQVKQQLLKGINYFLYNSSFCYSSAVPGVQC